MRSAFVCGRHIVISQLTGKTEPVERATFVKSCARRHNGTMCIVFGWNAQGASLVRFQIEPSGAAWPAIHWRWMERMDFERTAGEPIRGHAAVAGALERVESGLNASAS